MVDSTNFSTSVNSLLNIGNIDQNSFNSTLAQTANFFTTAASEIPFLSFLGSSSSSLTPVGDLETSLVNVINSLDEIQGTVTLADGVLVQAGGRNKSVNRRA